MLERNRRLSGLGHGSPSYSTDEQRKNCRSHKRFSRRLTCAIAEKPDFCGDSAWTSKKIRDFWPFLTHFDTPSADFPLKSGLATVSGDSCARRAEASRRPPGRALTCPGGSRISRARAYSRCKAVGA